jgi:hypothetical protein
LQHYWYVRDAIPVCAATILWREIREQLPQQHILFLNMSVPARVVMR